jgi:predicted deacylase
VVNIFGFETQDRYMPDRRDLNRFFPGSESGSLTSRVARAVFQALVPRCDYGIDLHTAAIPRTNFPNVRGDLSVPEVRRLAHAFGCELMINGKGPEGALRRAATRAGCPTIIFEAGEPGKIEPGILETGVRGIHNVLKTLSMMPGTPARPPFQTRVEKATWVRARVGGILRFHVAPGEPVDEGQPIATNASVFGLEQNVLRAPVSGVVLGVTTLPTVKPGEPVCYIAVPSRSLRSVRRALADAPDDSLHRRLRDDLATNISVSEREGEWTTETSPDDDG